MKIKLLRPLWNKKRNDVIDVTEPNAIWAIKKGYAELGEVNEIDQRETKPEPMNIEKKKGRKPKK